MKRFPLQVHVSTLFLLLILIVGGALALVGQRMSVQMMTEVADDLTHRITREVEGAVLRVVEPVETAVQLIAFDGVVRARTLEERLNSVALLGTALNQVPALASVYVGYPNGDFFFIRHLKTESERARARAPNGTHWVVQSIDRSNTRPRGTCTWTTTGASCVAKPGPTTPPATTPVNAAGTAAQPRRAGWC